MSETTTIIGKDVCEIEWQRERIFKSRMILCRLIDLKGASRQSHTLKELRAFKVRGLY